MIELPHISTVPYQPLVRRVNKRELESVQRNESTSDRVTTEFHRLPTRPWSKENIVTALNGHPCVFLKNDHHHHTYHSKTECVRIPWINEIVQTPNRIRIRSLAISDVGSVQNFKRIHRRISIPIVSGTSSQWSRFSPGVSDAWEYDKEKSKRKRKRRPFFWGKLCLCICLCVCLALLLAAIAALIVIFTRQQNTTTISTTTSSTSITSATTTTTTSRTSSTSSTSHTTSTASISTTSSTTSAATTTQTTTLVTRPVTTPDCTSSGGGYGKLLQQIGPTPSVWTQTILSYTATNVTDPILLFGFETAGGNYHYLDSVSVVDAATPSIELLDNPSFENSTSSSIGWTDWCAGTCNTVNTNGNPTERVTSSSCYLSIGSCLQVSCQPIGAGIFFFSQQFTATIGHTYTISFWQRHIGSNANEFYVDIA